MHLKRLLVTLLLLTPPLEGLAESNLMTHSPPGAFVYIISPKQGDTLRNPVTVVFGIKGMGVAPAGMDSPNTGHHHLLIDGDKLPPLTRPLADQVLHFGGGQTQTEITLTPGKHRLRLIFADKYHTPHNPPVLSDEIEITVE